MHIVSGYKNFFQDLYALGKILIIVDLFDLFILF